MQRRTDIPAYVLLPDLDISTLDIATVEALALNALRSSDIAHSHAAKAFYRMMARNLGDTLHRAELVQRVTLPIAKRTRKEAA